VSRRFLNAWADATTRLGEVGRAIRIAEQPTAVIRCKFATIGLQPPYHAIFPLVALAVVLVGCTDTADFFPLNGAAQHLGPVKASFVRTGAGRGPITMTMADGEELKGEYRVAFSSSVGMAFSGTRSSSALIISDGPVQFVATGPKTQMLCRGTSSTMGHGNGECQTYDGALWAINW
jgi:hypothetical protein